LSVCGFGVVSFCRGEVQFLLVMIWRWFFWSWK
jgi:hypothetical protein